MQLIEKLCFYKIEQIFNPYPPRPLSHGKGENTGTGVPATRLGATPQTCFTYKIYNSSID